MWLLLYIYQVIITVQYNVLPVDTYRTFIGKVITTSFWQVIISSIWQVITTTFWQVISSSIWQVITTSIPMGDEEGMLEGEDGTHYEGMVFNLLTGNQQGYQVRYSLTLIVCQLNLNGLS